MSGPDIFISYSSGDRTAARRFAQRFAEEGFTVWWDAALHSGETFDEVIENALKSAKAVVVLWSPRSVTSRWVRAEATLADRRNKLAPVTIEACDRPIIFELTHTADLSSWSGDPTDPAWRSLVKDLHRLVDRALNEEPVSKPTRPARPAAPEPRAASPAPARPLTYERHGRPEPEVERPLPKRVTIVAQPDDDDDEDERTQFYTGSGGYDVQEDIHCLDLYVGEELEQRYIVTAEGLKIGRAPPADVILLDARVSRSHCRVDLKNGHVEVTDLNSTNGTYVDGERIEGSAVLGVGSMLRVGNIVFIHEVRTGADA